MRLFLRKKNIKRVHSSVMRIIILTRVKTEAMMTLRLRAEEKGGSLKRERMMRLFLTVEG